MAKWNFNVDDAPTDGRAVLLKVDEQLLQREHPAPPNGAGVVIGRYDHPGGYWTTLEERTEWFSGSARTGSWEVTDRIVVTPIAWAELPED